MTSISPIVVIHESLISYEDLIIKLNSVNIEGSYHSLIKKDGSILYITSPEIPVIAAYNSIFNGFSIDNSVDSFAYHICLESPDVLISDIKHQGYTQEQYYSLAWLIKSTGISLDRITTHKEIDLSDKVIDPRSFDKQKLLNMIPLIETNKEIDIYR